MKRMAVFGSTIVLVIGAMTVGCAAQDGAATGTEPAQADTDNALTTGETDVVAEGANVRTKAAAAMAIIRGDVVQPKAFFPPQGCRTFEQVDQTLTSACRGDGWENWAGTAVRMEPCGPDRYNLVAYSCYRGVIR